MSNTLELSGLVVFLGKLIQFVSILGTEKITESRFASGISYTGWHYGIYIYIYIYIGFPTGKDGGGVAS